MPLVQGNVRSAQRVCAVHVFDAQLWDLKYPSESDHLPKTCRCMVAFVAEIDAQLWDLSLRMHRSGALGTEPQDRPSVG